MDLTLHIGLPKTGTTTIQWRVRHCPGYSARYSSRLKRICRSRRGAGWDRAAERWARDLHRSYQQGRAPSSAILLSSEAVFAGNPAVYRLKWPVFVRDLPPDTVRLLREPSAADYLRALQRVWPYGRVKVLLTLRNQSDWLGSLYAQMSDRINPASQDDFESEIGDLIGRGDDYIDWSRWIDAIEGVVGGPNLKILLLEEIHRPAYWEALLRFTGLGDCIDPIEVAAAQSAPRNVRRVKHQTWQLRRLRFPSPNLNEPYTALRALGSPSPGLYVRGTLLHAYRGLIDAPHRYRRGGHRPQDAEIAIGPELNAQIRSYCHPFNKRLAAQLQRDDLEELGY